MRLNKISKFLSGCFHVYSKCGKIHDAERELQRKHYCAAPIGREGTEVVVMVDGRFTHGGLSDRLRGIASVYGYCRDHGIDFKIHYTYPFSLTQYLLPNQCDWEIPDADISYSPAEAAPIVLTLDLLPSKLHKLYLARCLQQHKEKQLHVYTNTLFDDREYSRNFHELFRPTPKLQADIDSHLSAIGGKFIGIVFRFQQLLGDFKEDGYDILSYAEAARLVENCLQRIGSIRQSWPSHKVLITSDSITFLRKAQERYPYVCAVAKRVVHMDYTAAAGYEAYEKSFIDMFMLSRAEKVFMYHTGKMYRSGFAQRAAKINSVPYEEVKGDNA